MSAPVWPSYAAFGISCAALAGVGVNTWWSMHTFKETGHKVSFRASSFIHAGGPASELIANVTAVNSGRGAVDITRLGVEILYGTEPVLLPLVRPTFNEGPEDFPRRLEGNSQQRWAVNIYPTLHVFSSDQPSLGPAESFRMMAMLGNGEEVLAGSSHSVKQMLAYAEGRPD
jgi:hypothetical protein